MNIRTILAALATVLALLTPALRGQVPQFVNYQGRVVVGAVNFNGSGAFKFALVNAAGTTTYWSNDGTSVAGSQPTAAVTLTVTKGLYSVLLGDTAPPLSMTAIPASVWANPDVRLRVWFNDGTNGSQLLTPDQRLAPNGYLPDGSVTAPVLASGAVTSTKIANGAVGSTKIAAGAVQSANIAAGAVANTQLANSGITINAGSGLAGGGTPALGGSVTLTNAGVLSLTGGGGISVSAGTGAITLGSNATSANSAGTLVLRDGSGNFSAATITAAGAFNLPSTLDASTGLITQNGTPLMHTFGTINFFAGPAAGNFTMTGGNNTASGYQTLASNTTGNYNTASGNSALFANTTGNFNTASGAGALSLNTKGDNNTASGGLALTYNTTASRNVAVGPSALYTQSFSNGGVAWNSDNLAVGFEALYSNQPTATNNGNYNTAVGTQAMRSNTTGASNTASGVQALFANTNGIHNTALGKQALNSNTSGDANTASGSQALDSNTTGDSNTACGYGALNANTTGTHNTAIGYFAGVVAGFGGLTNTTTIGAGAEVNASNKVRIGDFAVTVIEGQVAYTFTSDRNKKENFLPVDGAEVLRKIRGFPLTSWNYIGTDEKPIRHYGVMAQDFYEAFGHDALGTIGTPITLNSGDMDGIMMSAIQALAAENAALKTQLAGREARDRERDERIARLERLLPAAPAGQKAGFQTASHNAR